MTTLTLSSKYQIVLPAEARKAMGLKSGDKLVLRRADKNEVVLAREPSIYDFMGILPPGDGDPVERIRKIRDMDD